MTNAEEMAMKTVHDLGVAGDWDVCNYTGLSPVEAGWAGSPPQVRGKHASARRDAAVDGITPAGAGKTN